MAIADVIRGRVPALNRTTSVRFTWLLDTERPSVVADCQLLDEYHDLQLKVMVDLKSLEIVAIEAETRRSPFATCPAAIGYYHCYLGKSFQYSRLLEQVKPDPTACVRLSELLLLGAANFSVALAYKIKADLYPEHLNDERMDAGSASFERRQALLRHFWMHHPSMADSCVSFNRSSRDAADAETVKNAAGSFVSLLKRFRRSVASPSRG